MRFGGGPSLHYSSLHMPLHKEPDQLQRFPQGCREERGCLSLGGSTAAPLHGWKLLGPENAELPYPLLRHSFTYGLHVIATPRRELDPLIFLINMQINLIKSGIVN